MRSELLLGDAQPAAGLAERESGARQRVDRNAQISRHLAASHRLAGRGTACPLPLLLSTVADGY